MKSFVVFLALLALVLTERSLFDQNEKHGCIIKENTGKCCWMNKNGCCSPKKPGQICTMALRQCCKTKTYNSITKTYSYTYN